MAFVVGLIIIGMGLAPLLWSFGLFGAGWLPRRLSVMKPLVGAGGAIMILIGLSTIYK